MTGNVLDTLHILTLMFQNYPCEEDAMIILILQIKSTEK